MNGFWAVFKREFKGYFATPVAYVFLVIFLFFAGYLTFKDGFFQVGQAELRIFFNWLPRLFAVLVPAVAMRLWAEERRTGSIELLFTLPITVTQAVLGKFFAAWAFMGLALALTFPLPMMVMRLGDPDVGLLVTGYLGGFLLAGAFLAIGSFFSVVSKNQVISLILSVVACSALVVAGWPTTLNYLSGFLPAGLVGAVESLSMQNHFDSMVKGVIEFKDLAYFAILTAAWIAASSILLNERKAD